MPKKAEIQNISFIEGKERKIEVLLSTGERVTIEPLYESFQQIGSNLWVTLPIAQIFNDWLHKEATVLECLQNFKEYGLDIDTEV